MNKKLQVAKPNDDVTVAVQKHELYSGPLPRPDDLAKYNEIVPGSAERILKMAEEEMKFRHKNDSTITHHATRVAMIGIIFAFLSVTMLSFVVFYALWRGFDVAAGSIAVGSIASV